MTTAAALSGDNNSDATTTPVIAILPQICLQGHSPVSRRQARKQRRRVAQRRPSAIDPRRASDQVDTDDYFGIVCVKTCSEVMQTIVREGIPKAQGDPNVIPKGIQK